MQLEKTITKLLKYGFEVNKVGNSSWGRFEKYEAKRGNFLIGMSWDRTEATLKSFKFKSNADELWINVPSLTVALREAGVMKAKKISEDSEKARNQLLTRWAKGLNLTDEQVISMNLHTRDDVAKAMEKAFPILSVTPRRETLKNTETKMRLNGKIISLWRRIQDAYKNKHPELAPLHKVKVSMTLTVPEGLVFDGGRNPYVVCYMPVFAWNAQEAKNTVKMMLSEMADIIYIDIVAVGTKQEALNAVKNLDWSRPGEIVKNEIERMERIQQSLFKQLEFYNKKLEFATFIEGVSSMIPTIGEAGISQNG